MILVILALLGLAFGSFVNALVWRIHAQSLSGKTAASKELSVLRGRSMCPECKHQLGALDLIPLLSWLFLKGKCRYCKKPISWQYPLVELLTPFIFVVSYLFWPYEIHNVAQYGYFIAWLVALTLGVALTLYDLKWMILPNRLIYPAGMVGVASALLSYSAVSHSQAASSVIGSLVFGGFFYGMYQVSKGKWIGGGDVRLGFVLGLFLGWQKSLLCLTLAAYLGTVLIGILFVIKKYHHKMKLPFGPFLLTAALITMLFGQHVIDWYLRLSGL